MTINIGVVQFPGSNTERETSLAIKRVKMKTIKIPSGEITNYFLLKKIAPLNKKIILSISKLCRINKNKINLNFIAIS